MLAGKLSSKLRRPEVPLLQIAQEGSTSPGGPCRSARQCARPPAKSVPALSASLIKQAALALPRHVCASHTATIKKGHETPDKGLKPPLWSASHLVKRALLGCSQGADIGLLKRL